MIRTEWRTSSPRPVAVVWLDRSDKKNAMTPAMLDDLSSALAAAAERAAAIVLVGAGSTFCAGFDLTLCKDNADALRQLLIGLSRTIRLMREVSVPVVIGAQGAAIAGGCALLAGADVVVTHSECRLGYPVVRLGISPAVNAPFLARSVGHGHTREKLLGGRIFDGREAIVCGLAHELAPTPEQVPGLAMVIADRLAVKPHSGIAATKAWLNELDGCDGWAERALSASLALVGTSEERERLAALRG